MNTIDFPTWFSYGCYGGLTCCMLAIVVNALYTTLCRRGTTRQLAIALISAVVSALLLLPALLWYNLRFNVEQATLSSLEIGLVLVYVVLCGWLSPCGVTIMYCLFTAPRDSNTAGRLPRQRGQRVRTQEMAVSAQPPRRQPGKVAPFVYNAETPWGWLEYRNGKFLGQELALKRAVISIGREEDNEIELDDDTISRYHAELAWDKGQVYVTDNGSLNGVLLNGRRIRSSVLVKNGDLLEIGAHHFLMKYAQRPASLDLDDPLLPHLRRASRSSADNQLPSDPQPGSKPPASPTRALQPGRSSAPPTHTPIPASGDDQVSPAWEGTPAPERPGGLCIIRNGDMAGRSFLLDRPILTVGRGNESDVVIYSVAISRRHLQFSHQAGEDYVQDLASRSGSQVNGEVLKTSRLLQAGDIITLGDIQLEYLLISDAQTTRIQVTSPEPEPLKLPMQLRLPTKFPH